VMLFERRLPHGRGNGFKAALGQNPEGDLSSRARYARLPRRCRTRMDARTARRTKKIGKPFWGCR
jgi:hypothetical protein